MKRKEVGNALYELQRLGDPFASSSVRGPKPDAELVDVTRALERGVSKRPQLPSGACNRSFFTARLGDSDKVRQLPERMFRTCSTLNTLHSLLLKEPHQLCPTDRMSWTRRREDRDPKRGAGPRRGAETEGDSRGPSLRLTSSFWKVLLFEGAGPRASFPGPRATDDGLSARCSAITGIAFDAEGAALPH